MDLLTTKIINLPIKMPQYNMYNMYNIQQI